MPVGNAPETERLTGHESHILRIVREFGEPIAENQVHLLAYVEVAPLDDKDICGFTDTLWGDIDEGYRRVPVKSPYSPVFHGAFQSLLKKGYLAKNSERPLLVSEIRG